MSKIRWLIYIQPLHRIILFILLIVCAWAVIERYRGQEKWWRIVNLIGFLGTVAVILYMTVYRTGEARQELVFRPFQSFVEAKEQPELYRSMLMNAFLFVPLGLSMTQLVRCRYRVLLPIVFGLCLSVAVEVVQYCFALGRSEVDDVIMNTLGTLIGALCVPLAALLGTFIEKLKKRNDRRASQ